MLTYLRDPPWLLTMTSGMRNWQSDRAGARFRWTGGHASFFVPADARIVEIPLRAAFENPDDGTVTVRVALDDRPVDRIVLSDGSWRQSVIRLPPSGSRRVRRVDIRVDRTRDDNHGVQVGELTLR